MYHIKEIIRSFLILRQVVLRELSETGINRNTILESVYISAAQYSKRRKNTKTWTIDEIERLADLFNFNPKACKSIKQLALILDLVPPLIKMEVLKAATLDEEKLATRRKNYNKC